MTEVFFSEPRLRIKYKFQIQNNIYRAFGVFEPWMVGWCRLEPPPPQDFKRQPGRSTPPPAHCLPKHHRGTSGTPLPPISSIGNFAAVLLLFFRFSAFFLFLARYYFFTSRFTPPPPSPPWRNHPDSLSPPCCPAKIMSSFQLVFIYFIVHQAKLLFLSSISCPHHNLYSF